MYSRPKCVVEARYIFGAITDAASDSTPGELSLYKFPNESSASIRWTRFVVMNVFSPFTCGAPPSTGNCAASPPRVRTPPGKNSTSARFGDSPGGTSDGSSNVIHDPNVFSGSGAKDSIDIVHPREIAFACASYWHRNPQRTTTRVPSVIAFTRSTCRSVTAAS